MPPLPVFRDEANVPRRVANLAFLELCAYPDARLGAAFRYTGSGGVKADAYLYNPFGQPPPLDLRHPQLADAFRVAIGEIIDAARRGLYLDLDVTSTHYLHVPEGSRDPFCFRAAFRYRQALGAGVEYEGLLASHLALRVDAGLLNKVRYTYPADHEAVEMPGFLAFLTEWAAAVQGAAQGVTGET